MLDKFRLHAAAMLIVACAVTHAAAGEVRIGIALDEAVESEIVLGGPAALAIRQAPERHITRIERYATSSEQATSGSLILNGSDFAPLSPTPPPLPVIDENALAAAAKPRLADQAAAANRLIEAESAEPEMTPEQADWNGFVLWSLIAATGVASLSRMRVFALIDRLLFEAIAKIAWPNVRVLSHSGQRRKRRRRSRSRRHRTADIGWYFRHTAAGVRSGRHRWRRSSRGRDFVVADVVFTTPPPPSTNRYLLTCNN